MKYLIGIVLIGLLTSCGDAKGDSTTKTESVKNPEAQEWFDKAYNSDDYNYQVSCYAKCLSYDKDFALAYYNRGLAYKNLGRHQEAIDDYNTAIKINPDYADAYINRGVAKEQLGIDDCSDYKKACELGEEMGCKYYKEDGCN